MGEKQSPKIFKTHNMVVVGKASHYICKILLLKSKLGKLS